MHHAAAECEIGSDPCRYIAERQRRARKQLLRTLNLQSALQVRGFSAVVSFSCAASRPGLMQPLGRQQLCGHACETLPWPSSAQQRRCDALCGLLQACRSHVQEARQHLHQASTRLKSLQQETEQIEAARCEGGPHVNAGLPQPLQASLASQPPLIMQASWHSIAVLAACCHKASSRHDHGADSTAGELVTGLRAG